MPVDVADQIREAEESSNFDPGKRLRPKASITVDDLRRRTTLTIPEAGRVIGFKSESAAYRAAANGHMPGLREVGGRKFVSAPVLLAWLLGEGEA